MPVWPTSRGWATSLSRDLRAGDPVTETELRTDVHCGSHVDAPLHHLVGGRPVDGIPLEAFVGPVLIVDAQGHREVPVEAVQGLGSNVRRVLFRTDNSERRLMREPRFAPDFVGLSLAAARALADREDLLLVGNDYLSVQPFEGDDDVHRVLLRRNVALLEGLDLAEVTPGWYELIALPMLLPGAEAAPVRAVLAPYKSSTEAAS